MIYILNNLNFLEESFVAKDICSIDFQNVDNTDKKEEFIENIYQNALGNIGKSGICVTNLNSINENNNYEIINSEIPLLIPSYIMANSMLIISAFLKKEYNINAIIFDKIVNNSIYAAGTFSAMKIVTLFVIILTCSMSLAMFLGIIGADKIKERVKNIKQLLYLSGNDMLSYWLGFLVVDASKFIIFSLLSGAIIYLISGYATFILIDLLILTFPTLVFVYSLSFLFEKEETFQIFFSVIITVIMLLVMFIIILFWHKFKCFIFIE